MTRSDNPYFRPRDADQPQPAPVWSAVHVGTSVHAELLCPTDSEHRVRITQHFPNGASKSPGEFVVFATCASCIGAARLLLVDSAEHRST